MKKYWDKIEVGHSLATLTKAPISRLHLAHFAAASDDFSPLHLDDEYAKSAGFGSVFVPGLLALGITEEALAAFGINVNLVSLSGTFQRLIWPGDTLSAKGVILRRYQSHSEHRAQFAVWVENQNGEVVMKGQAVMSLYKNAEDEAHQRSTIPPIAKATHEALVAKCEKLGISHKAASSRVSAEKELA